MAREFKKATEDNTSVAPETLENALATIATQNEIIAEQTAEITALQSKIEQYKTGNIVLPEITIDGETYAINNGSLHDGKRYTRDELAKNEVVCKSILAISGQGTLTLIMEGE